MGKILFHQPEVISLAAISESDIATWTEKWAGWIRAKLAEEDDERQMGLRLIYDRLSTVSSPSSLPQALFNHNDRRTLVTVAPKDVYSPDVLRQG